MLAIVVWSAVSFLCICLAFYVLANAVEVGLNVWKKR